MRHQGFLGIQHLHTISRSTTSRIQAAGRLCLRIQTVCHGQRGLSHHTTRLLTVRCRVNGPRHLSHFPLFCFTAKTVQTTLRTMFCLNSTLCFLRNEQTSASSSGVHSAPDTLCALVLGRFAGSLAESRWPSWYSVLVIVVPWRYGVEIAPMVCICAGNGATLPALSQYHCST